MVYENVCFPLTASPSPLAYFFPYGLCTRATVYPMFRVFTMVKGAGNPPVWVRNTYFQERSVPLNMYDAVMVSDKQKRAGGTAYPAKMKFGDGYRLQPLYGPDSSGKVKLNAKAMGMAKTANPYVLIRDY